MPVIDTTITIQAPIERVFDSARSIDLHVDSSNDSNEQAIAGRTRGLIEMGEEVCWRAKHVGIWFHMSNRITVMDMPRRFHDSMTHGMFKHFEHDHLFEETDVGTTMRDVIDFKSPFGIIGVAVDFVVLKRYLTSFIEQRALYIKQVAESDAWGKYI